MTAARKPRSAESIARKNARDRQRRKERRDAAGKPSWEQWVAFVREQAAKTKAARVQPSVAKRVVTSCTKPGESLEAFMARGGKVERLPGPEFRPFASGVPARHYAKAGWSL